jgi:hypothetical protein
MNPEIERAGRHSNDAEPRSDSINHRLGTEITGEKSHRIEVTKRTKEKNI